MKQPTHQTPHDSAGSRFRPAACLLLAAALALASACSGSSKPVLKYDASQSMVLVPGGSAQIGDTNGDSDETNVHQQDFSAFWIGVHEVGTGEFAAFRRDVPDMAPPIPDDTSRIVPPDWGAASRASEQTPGSAAADAADAKPILDPPASGISWFEAIAYCNWRSAKEGLAKVYTIDGSKVAADWNANGYRLPSEAEWEYAARGGPYYDHKPFPGANNAGDVAHYRENSWRKFPRGEMLPNELGLYDMAGNVAEWTWDVYGQYPITAQADYLGMAEGDYRVIRGGAWDDFEKDMRVSDRNFLDPATREPTMGFRLARNASGEDSKAIVAVASAAPLPPPPADAPYKNPKLPVAQRVADLLARMSLEEKLGQMTQIAYDFLDSSDSVTRAGLGSLLAGGDMQPGEGSPAEWAALAGGYRKAALAGRLGIPLLFGIDGVHGIAKVKGATIFPHNLGLGAANDPALTQAMGAAVAAEMRASGLDWNFAPCVAVARDERWGRSYESFGEDPQLSSRLGAAYILGLQGTTLGPGSVVATAKHYLADGGTLGGVDRGNAVMDEAELRRIHLAPYAAAVKAGAGSVMASFSSWNDLQMHANRKLLTDVLRGELGFTGVVVSDWAAHKLLPGNPPRQVKTMVMAGVDVCMVPDDMGRNGYLAVLHELALSGEIPAARIDEAVSRILTLKFTIGLFEKPYGPPADSSAIGSPAHRQVARQLAAKSLVVLKNSQVLPVKAGTILVTGGLADNVAAQCGGWTMGWQNPTGKIEGATSLKAAIAARAKAGGMGVAFSDAATLPAGPKPGLAIVIAGERPYAETAGDRQDLRLPAADRELIRSLKKQGVPVLLLLVSGRPLVITELLPDLDGLVAAWLPGSEGAGVADVLFGDVKPSGRLPMSWPVSNEQLPVNAGDGKTALFPYGFGLGW